MISSLGNVDRVEVDISALKENDLQDVKTTVICKKDKETMHILVLI